MKVSKSQTTSYKDFIQKFTQPETPLSQKQTKIRKPLTLRKTNHNASQRQFEHHTQSTSVWERALTSYSNEKCQNEHNQSTQRQNASQQNSKKIVHAYNKYISEITAILVEITKVKPPQMLAQKISYIEYLEALKQLRLIHDSYEPHPNDLVGQLWAEIISSQNSIGHFILVIATVLKVNRYDHLQNQNNKYIWQKYSKLRYTRLELKGKKISTQADCSQFPFCPQISEKSKTLATSRSKSKGRKMYTMQSKQNLPPFTTRDQQNSSMYSNFVRAENLGENMLGVKRSEILYQLAKEKSVQKKLDKTSNQVQFQKSINELTFKPKIHPCAKDKKKTRVNGEQNSISRMIRGRVQREVKRVINQKGLPYNDKIVQKMRKQKYEALMKEKKLLNQENGIADAFSPKSSQSLYLKSYSEEENQKRQKQELSSKQEQTEEKVQRLSKNQVVLDIYVDEDHCQKLVIGENESLQSAAANFVKKNNLSQEMHQKLVKQLEKAMKFQLTQIDQNSIEEDTEEHAQTDQFQTTFQ